MYTQSTTNIIIISFNIIYVTSSTRIINMTLTLQWLTPTKRNICNHGIWIGCCNNNGQFEFSYKNIGSVLFVQYRVMNLLDEIALR